MDSTSFLRGVPGQSISAKVVFVLEKARPWPTRRGIRSEREEDDLAVLGMR
jgi:hypothetical protein